MSDANKQSLNPAVTPGIWTIATAFGTFTSILTLLDIRGSLNYIILAIIMLWVVYIIVMLVYMSMATGTDSKFMFGYMRQTFGYSYVALVVFSCVVMFFFGGEVGGFELRSRHTLNAVSFVLLQVALSYYYFFSNAYYLRTAMECGKDGATVGVDGACYKPCDPGYCGLGPACVKIVDGKTCGVYVTGDPKDLEAMPTYNEENEAQN